MTSTYQPATAITTRGAETRDRRPLLFLLALLTVALDQITKFLIITHVRSGEHITVIPRVFRISHVLNTGAAFSFLDESAHPDAVRYGLIAFSIFAVIIVGAMIARTGRALSLSGIALALILGGALGNLYDRIVHHFVIDFLEVHIIGYHWPDFNVADSAICIGATLLILEIFRPQPAEASALPPSS